MSKDIDESYRNITFQLYHIKGGLSTLSVEIGLNSLKKPNRHTLRQPNSVLRKIRLKKRSSFSYPLPFPYLPFITQANPLAVRKAGSLKCPPLFHSRAQ